MPKKKDISSEEYIQMLEQHLDKAVIDLNTLFTIIERLNKFLLTLTDEDSVNIRVAVRNIQSTMDRMKGRYSQ